MFDSDGGDNEWKFLERSCIFSVLPHVICFAFDTTAPQGARVSPFTRFLYHKKDAPQSIGLLWMSDQLVAETST